MRSRAPARDTTGIVLSHRTFRNCDGQCPRPTHDRSEQSGLPGLKGGLGPSPRVAGKQRNSTSSHPRASTSNPRQVQPQGLQRGSSSGTGSGGAAPSSKGGWAGNKDTPTSSYPSQYEQTSPSPTTGSPEGAALAGLWTCPHNVQVGRVGGNQRSPRRYRLHVPPRQRPQRLDNRAELRLTCLQPRLDLLPVPQPSQARPRRPVGAAPVRVPEE